MELRVKKLKRGKASGKDEVIGKMIKNGQELVIDFDWCNSSS